MLHIRVEPLEHSTVDEEKQSLVNGGPLGVDGTTKPRARFSPAKFAICLILMMLGLFCLMFLDGEKVQVIVDWLKTHQKESAVIFVVFGALGTIILFPGTVLCVSAGAAYGVPLGSCLAWMAIVVGQTAAFGLGRYILRGLVVHHACQAISNFQAIDAAIAKNGWKLIFLLRLSPFIPYNLLNYALAVTGIGLAQFTIASSLSIIPWILFLAYVGAATRSAVFESSSVAFKFRELGWGPWCLSLVLTVIMIIGIGVLTKRAIHHALLQASKDRDVEIPEIQVSETEPM